MNRYPTDEEIQDARKALGKKGKLKIPVMKVPKPITDDCPVCGAKDQETDIIAHGPGVGVLGYECGCSVSSKDGRPTAYRKYDGTVTYGE